MCLCVVRYVYVTFGSIDCPARSAFKHNNIPSPGAMDTLTAISIAFAFLFCRVTTKYVMVVQHDRPFVDGFALDRVLDAMDKEPELLKLVERFVLSWSFELPYRVSEYPFSKLHIDREYHWRYSEEFLGYMYLHFVVSVHGKLIIMHMFDA